MSILVFARLRVHFLCTGWLEFMYVGGSVPLDSSVTLRSRSLKQKPTVHFELDLSIPVDHHTAVLLVERALKVSSLIQASTIFATV